MSDIKEQRSKRFAQLIGYELKANFAREGTSQAEVAERLGHSKSGYSRWINAKPSMPLEAFINTCELINVDPRQVVDAAYTRLIEELETHRRLHKSPMISRRILICTIWPRIRMKTRSLRRKRQGIRQSAA